MSLKASERALVERRESGQAPTSFRIWGHGPNEIDGAKPAVFSERSAEALLAEQAARARIYSFDFDHRSMLPDVSPEAGKAAGWHVLEVRQDESGKPELWATSCDWTAAARAGLEADPPEWRYFSPCFVRDAETNEVTSYTGCALTNNPLTRGLPALASAVIDARDDGADLTAFETVVQAAAAVVRDARDQGRDDCMDDLVDESHIERLRKALAALDTAPAADPPSPVAASAADAPPAIDVPPAAATPTPAGPGRLARARAAALLARLLTRI